METSHGFFLFVHSIMYVFGRKEEFSILAEKHIKKKINSERKNNN